MPTLPENFILPPLPPVEEQPVPIVQGPGGLQFKDAAPLLCGVVDNGVPSDDPRVLMRTNEATKIVLDNMIPVGGMATFNVQAFGNFIVLPPQLENVIEALPFQGGASVYGQTDIAQGWYEIVNQSTFLDPAQHHDNPLIDYGLFRDSDDAKVLRRVYQYPGLTQNATVTVTGAKRYLPLKGNEDYLIVQNIEALKCIILSIERYENNDPDGAQKYRAAGLELLQKEVVKHILDPRNYMRRKSAYTDDLETFPEGTLGWTRAAIALDIPAALKTGKIDLTFSIQQVEKRLMQRGTWKDTIVPVEATVTGGIVYFPIHVQSVLAINLCGAPIPIRSQFFQHLENGPGAFSCSNMLIDQGDEYFPGSKVTRRKYKLVAHCDEGQLISAICKLRWLPKKPTDMMVIKNYEAIRLMMTAKFLEEDEKWDDANKNKGEAIGVLQSELDEYLSGILHTIHVQTYGFGLGDVGSGW